MIWLPKFLKPQQPKLHLGGRFRWSVWDRDVMLRHGVTKNGIILAQIDDLFDVYFSNGTPASAWYIGLIEASTFSALSTSDSMSSHSGWTELTDYDEGTRPAWSPANSSNQIKANSSAVVFTASSDMSVKGFFVTSDNTKGGVSGDLWSHSIGSVDQDIPSGQTFKAFYELTGREG